MTNVKWIKTNVKDFSKKFCKDITKFSCMESNLSDGFYIVKYVSKKYGCEGTHHQCFRVENGKLYDTAHIILNDDLVAYAKFE